MEQNEKDKGKIISTADGSSTFVHEVYGDTYHSIHGALTESTHVYILNGLEYQYKQGNSRINILEFGFGTGLNAALSFKAANKLSCALSYTGIDNVPLDPSMFENFAVPQHLRSLIVQLQMQHWSEPLFLTNKNRFLKIVSSFETFSSHQKFNLIYYDAFAPATQPELWSPEMIKHVVGFMSENAVFVSYCSKGSFKRTLKELGLHVEGLPGAPGKREMTRAIKKNVD